MSYIETLNQAWQDHLAPRKPNEPTVISLFAGCGGSSLGYSMAGFREVLAAEWDDHAVDVFRKNFPDAPVFHGDIVKLSVEECLEMSGVFIGELDVLDGSPPCQGFSTAGRRAFTDQRNSLFMEFVRLLRGLSPKAFVMENVSGLVKGKMKILFRDMLQALKESGYAVSVRLLNASHYGVPQLRERVIFIGVRNDLGVTPSHPVGRYAPISLREALHDCEPSEIMPLTGRNKVMLSMVKPGAKSSERNRAAVAAFGKVRNFNLLKLSWSQPSPTVLKSMRVSGDFGSGLVMPDEDRYLSISELKRICSFPDQFQMTGTYVEKWGRLGNSVPPLLMKSIADHIKTHILERK